ncbi:unnamed protein product [Prunus armeniaca]
MLGVVRLLGLGREKLTSAKAVGLGSWVSVRLFASLPIVSPRCLPFGKAFSIPFSYKEFGREDERVLGFYREPRRWMNTLNMSMNIMNTLNIGMNLLNMSESSDRESHEPPAFGGEDTESEEPSQYVCSEDESSQTEGVVEGMIESRIVVHEGVRGEPSVDSGSAAYKEM